MADLVAVLSADSSGLQKALNNAKKTLQDYKKDATTTSNVTQQQVNAFNNSVNSLNKLTNSAKSHTQQMKGLENQIVNLTMQYNALSNEAKNNGFGEALGKTITEAKNRFNELKTTTDEVKDALHGQQEQSASSSDALGKLSEMVGVNIGTLGKLTSIVGVGTLAFNEMKSAIFLNESAIDEWGRSVKAAEAAHNTFLHALNSGNWSNFFTNLQNAIRGARQLYNEFDRLGSIKTNNAAAIALVDAELAGLRKLKKEGKDVQKQIDNALTRRKALVNEGVVAGKTANRDAIAANLRQYNPRLSDAAAKKQADNLLKGGQKTYDAAEKTIKNIEKYARNHYGKKTKTEYIDGQTVTRQLTQAEMLAMLPKNMQSQYRTSKALLQSETANSPFVAGYAASVNEGTQNTNQDLRFISKGGGSGGGKSGAGKSGGSNQESELEKALKAATAAIEKINGKAKESLFELENTTPESPAQAQSKKIFNDDGSFYNPLAELLKDTGTETPELFRDWNAEDVEKYTAAIKRLGHEFDDLEKASNVARQTGEIFQNLGSSFSELGAAFGSVEFNVAGIIAQAIASVALSFAEALRTCKTWYEWLAFGVSGAATMVSMISQIKSATSGYANGGIINANTKIGDYGLARVNGGEMILNGTQQKHLFSLLDGGVIGNEIKNSTHNVEFKIKGKNLVGVENTYYKRQSKL